MALNRTSLSMLTPQDIKNIGVEVGKVIEHNVTPALAEMHQEIGTIKGEISSIKTELGSIKSQMVTKSYLDDKLAELEGTTVVRQRNRGPEG